MQKKCQFKNGYTFNRVINGCWQLSAEHCLQGHLDYDDAIRAFVGMLFESRCGERCRGFR